MGLSEGLMPASGAPTAAACSVLEGRADLGFLVLGPS